MSNNALRRAAAIGLAAVVTLASACSSGPPAPVHPDERSYEQQILAWRADKDAMFRTSDQFSPIPAPLRATFVGLPYYPIEPAFHVPASLTEDRSGPPVVIELPTSKGVTRREQRVGTLTFTLQGQAFTLTAFASEDEGTKRLFVPFRDLTSGIETYGGGRYLDIDRASTGVYDLDFNRAYHPSCVYNEGYECPVPPAENKVGIAIRAGEKLAGK